MDPDERTGTDAMVYLVTADPGRDQLGASHDAMGSACDPSEQLLHWGDFARHYRAKSPRCRS
jgi:hypothetical protein